MRLVCHYLYAMKFLFFSLNEFPFFPSNLAAKRPIPTPIFQTQGIEAFSSIATGFLQYRKRSPSLPWEIISVPVVRPAYGTTGLLLTREHRSMLAVTSLSAYIMFLT